MGTVRRDAERMLRGVAQRAGGRRTASHHRDIQGGAQRAAVFGISDGLLTNVSLILGVAGANPSSGLVRLSGLAGLLAGAFSMAAGEYVSMSAQSELLQREMNVERRELREHPRTERQEMVTLYQRRGLRPELAEEVADALQRDPEVALEVHGREELGIDPSETGNPYAAAVSSFASFAVGAFLPLLPWFFTTGRVAVIISVTVSAVAALAIGWAVAQFTGRSRLRSALRQLAIAVAAASVTYGISSAVGGRAAG
jgi:VIT1/CCC1 family predicted Fe2+/Mn2+ transporter